MPLTATDIAGMHHRNCSLALRLAHDRPHDQSKQFSVRTSALFQRGNKWEAHLTTILRRENLLLDLSGTHQNSNATLLFDSISKDTRFLFFITGVVFPPNSTLFKTSLRTTKPDYIRVTKNTDGSIILAVIDAKISHTLKVSHQIQIGIYAASLIQIIKEQCPANLVVSVDNVKFLVYLSPPKGALWPTSKEYFGNSDGAFSLTTVFPLLENTLNKIVPTILNEENLEALEWGVGDRCEECEFEPGCIARAKTVGDVSLVGGTMGRDRAALKTVVELAKSQNLVIRGKFSKKFDTGIPNTSEWNEFWIKRCSNNIVGSNNFTDIEYLDAAIKTPGFFDRFESSHPSICSTVNRLLKLSATRNDSPVVKSVLENTVKPIHKIPYSAFPKSEDHAVFISTVSDPLSDDIVAVSILHKNQTHILYRETIISKNPNENNLSFQFTQSLANIINFLLVHATPTPRVQFYTFTAVEKREITDMIVSEICTTKDPQSLENAQLCAAALLDHPTVLLSTLIPIPLLMSKSQLIGAKIPKLKADIQWYLQAIEGTESRRNETVVKLKQRIEDIVADNVEISLIPRVVVVADVVKNAVVLPAVSRITLETCAQMLLGVSQLASVETVYQLWVNGNRENDIRESLESWNFVCSNICLDIRRRISAVSPIETVFVNELAEFRVVQLDLCKDSVLSRLLFLTQFEMIKEFQSIKELRLNSNQSNELEYIGAVPNSGIIFEHRFLVHSGLSTIQSKYNSDESSSFEMFDWILVTSNTPHATKFNDLLHMSQAYSHLKLNDDEVKEFGEHVCFANISNVNDAQGTVTVKVKCAKGFKFVNGDGKRKIFDLYPRFVDFNTQKSVRGIIETEITRLKRIESNEPAPLFLRLVAPETQNSSESIKTWNLKTSSQKQDSAQETILYRLYRELYDLKTLDTHSRPFHFLPSQHAAVKGAIENVVTIVWGPPGNGKTHTLALSCLRLIETSARLGRKNCCILMTAFTNAAIKTFKDKVEELLEHRKQDWFKDVSFSEWTKSISVCDLKDNNPLGSSWSYDLLYTRRSIFKLFEATPALKGTFDILVIDEGSQFLTSCCTIAFQAIDIPDISTKRLIIAGDHRQLGPLLKANYPTPPESRPLFGSILDCLIHQNEPITFMLKDNFRFVESLCRFTERLYVNKNDQFIPMRGSQTMISNSIDSWFQTHTATDKLNAIVKKIGRTSLVSILLNGKLDKTSTQASFEDHISREANLAASLVKLFHEIVPDGRIFVITPHKLQRAHLLHLLATHTHRGSKYLRIDTVERMQGDQADIVLACYGFTSHTPTFENELEFVYSIRRINVALSRPKALCILISSRNLFEPPASVLGLQSSREGLDHLCRFRERSIEFGWSGDEQLELEDGIATLQI
ncbi:hypothetical protein HK100_001105 [Physocladia obscura]|uniref:DNA2/NAM7 helicase-like C-terminal domain-containing protein n=1 Tax=Physocladia obscura TaxID=109957 RepID=A0AAD5SXG8_9FUNG|nr:hypothetical protein HK100_001105 [Physocladia obscura]